jgi:23S rRNA (adenine2503-C2)-methyltransferase
MSKKLCGATIGELSSFLSEMGFKDNHASKILIAIYRKRVFSTVEISNIPVALKNALNEHYSSGIFPPLHSQQSIDGTVKYLFRNESGLEFETVYLPEKKRRTVCISTQAGCRMGCPFCVTGKYGFRGNLTASDMINQIISLPLPGSVTHIVFMGMGEPMDNVEEVLKACKILTSEWGLAISPGNVTVSSIGIQPGLTEFLNKSDCNLTLSLHSPFPDERRKMIPVENKFPVREILEKLKYYPLNKKRRLSIAYIMIKGLNDTDDHLQELISLLRGTSIRVNLLPFHKITDDGSESSPDERMQFFKHNLIISGISASIRKSRGEDISAACGLLAADLM